MSSRVFFLGEGDWESPQAPKNWSVPPPNQPPSLLFDQSLSPQLSFVPENFKNFTSFFSQYFLAQICIRKLYFLLKPPKFALFCCGDIFGLSGQFVQVPPYLTPTAKQGPPSDSVPNGDRKSSLKANPPTKNFVKKPCPPTS